MIARHALLVIVALSLGCSHRQPAIPSPHADEDDGPTPATFMATYEVVRVEDVPHTYGRQAYEIRRHDPLDGTGRAFLSVTVTPSIDPELARSLKVGAKVNVIILPD